MKNKILAERDFLMRKLNEGLLVVEEWKAVIVDMRVAGLFSAAATMKMRMEYYIEKWGLAA